MKVAFLVFNLIILIILFFNCHGVLDVAGEEIDSPLLGTWKYYYLDGSDSVIHIYKFFHNNKLEIIEIYSSHYKGQDTTFKTGSYVVPTSNLMFTAINSPYPAKQTMSRDTIVFYITGNELRFCPWGRSYHQLSGKANKLHNGEFYRVHESVQDNYSHELYRFSGDTLHTLYTLTKSTKFPEEWEYYRKHKYTTVEVFIQLEESTHMYTMGYNFYRHKLILAGEPYRFEKVD